MRKTAALLASGLLLVLSATPVLASAIPKLPHAFYGNVLVNGAPAPNGTQVWATVNLGQTVPNQNPVTTVGGSYGISSPYLLVQGYDIPDGASITFLVTTADGTTSGGTAQFVAGGGPTRKDLSVTIIPPPSTQTVTATVFGEPLTFDISPDGVVQQDIALTSGDGKLSISIPQGTTALDKDGNPISTLTTETSETPPPPPPDTAMVGLAYDFGPDGATFDPPITLTWVYDPAELPEGVAEGDLTLAYYDVSAGEWVELESVVDTANHTVTPSVSHFTTFALIGTPKPAAFTVSSLRVSPDVLAPGEKVTIVVSVANTGGREGSRTLVLEINDVKEAQRTVTVAPGASEEVTFTVVKDKPGEYIVMVGGLGGSFTVLVPPAPPEAPAAFSVSGLSIRPAEVKPDTPVTISVSVANTGGTEGSYDVVLTVNGVKEAEQSVTVAAEKSETVSFTVSKKEAGSYSVEIDGLTGSFTVVEAAPTPPVTPPAVEKPWLTWPVIGGIVGGVIVVALIVIFVRRRRIA